MFRQILLVQCLLLAVILTGFGFPSASKAANLSSPLPAGSPYDLINAVNALRASFGLPPYSISPILMATAQAQADFMASTGRMTHSGPDGIGLTARLLDAGYPLAGDLSAGGFRAENITGGNESMPAETAIDHWSGDALHLNTMISQDLTEIGAGVAIRDARVYYVIDAARPTNVEPASVGTAVAGSPVAEIPAVILPIPVSTSNGEGNIIHEVKPGQTLWQIAISYGTRIDEIKRLNNLTDNNIYPGTKLLIRSGVTLVTSTAMETPTPDPTATSLTPSPEISQQITAIAKPSASQANPNLVTSITAGIILLALAGGGIFALLGRSRKH